jgi:hypothetical protein
MSRRRVLGVALVSILAVLLVSGAWAAAQRSSDLDRRSTTNPPAAPPGTAVSSNTPRPAATPVSTMVVQDLVVCDATIDCGVPPSQGLVVELTACFRASAADGATPLVLLVTGRNVAPSGPEDPWVVARSTPIQGSGSLTCYAVRAVGAPLVEPEYWLWVLAESTVLAQKRIILAQ